MLTLEQLRTHYAAHAGYARHARSILTEYIQYELLDSLFKQPRAGLLSFMGGTSIRIVYGSGRFSEDLDFDNFGLSYEEFRSLLDDVVRDMRMKGFGAEYRFVEKAAFHCYVRFPKILQDNALSSHDDEKILVRIDTMQKKKLREPNVAILNAFDVYRPITVNAPAVILAQKLIAIKDRLREKGRDFYDGSFLYGMAEPDTGFIEETTGMPIGDFIGALLDRCRMLDFARLAKDVEPFLFRNEEVVRVETFLPFIEQKLHQ